MKRSTYNKMKKLNLDQLVQWLVTRDISLDELKLPENMSSLEIYLKSRSMIQNLETELFSKNYNELDNFQGLHGQISKDKLGNLLRGAFKDSDGNTIALGRSCIYNSIEKTLWFEFLVLKDRVNFNDLIMNGTLEVFNDLGELVQIFDLYKFETYQDTGSQQYRIVFSVEPIMNSNIP